MSDKKAKYHRRAGLKERDMVSSSGELWGKAPRLSAGNGPPCVKAFLGPLPAGTSGYTFETSVNPTRTRNFMGLRGAVWVEGAKGVSDVAGQSGHVSIPVKVI